MSKDEISYVLIDALGSSDQDIIKQTTEIYQKAFADPPYCEYFSDTEAKDALQFILDKDGDLILGSTDGKVVSLAGGYFNAPGEYFIEELAVDPSLQGQGLGRKTLRSLIDRALEQGTSMFEICTSSENVQAIKLYESEDFVREPVLKATPHF